MKNLIIKASIRTESPLSIAMPIAEGAIANRYKNFPLMTRGVDADGNKQQTAYLPSTTMRGFLRRAIVTDAMRVAADAGKHYTLQRAYADLIGQDSASEEKQDVDLLKLKATREENPVIDLFGCGMSVKSRLLVSHFVPANNILPEAFSGVRKDLDDTDGVLDLISESDRESFLGRTEANSSRAQAASVVKDLQRKIKASAKKGEPTADLDEALLKAEQLVEKYEASMGAMQNSTRTLVGYYALPAGIDLIGRMVIENVRDRDLPMIELALNALSLRPLLGAQTARGCGEISGTFDVLSDGHLIKKIAIGGWESAKMVDFLNAGHGEKAA